MPALERVRIRLSTVQTGSDGATRARSVSLHAERENPLRVVCGSGVLLVSVCVIRRALTLDLCGRRAVERELGERAHKLDSLTLREEREITITLVRSSPLDVVNHSLHTR